MLFYCKGVIFCYFFLLLFICINEYDVEILLFCFGFKWCIQEGVKDNLFLEVYSYVIFDFLCKIQKGVVKDFLGVDEVVEVMKVGWYFGNWLL